MRNQFFHLRNKGYYSLKSLDYTQAIDTSVSSFLPSNSDPSKIFTLYLYPLGTLIDLSPCFHSDLYRSPISSQTILESP